MKTKEFLRAAFANGQRKTWCPCVRCDNYKQATEVDMGNTCRSGVISLVIRCGPSMESLADDGERRWSVSARMSTEPGSKTWCRTLTMRGMKTMRWRNLRRPSMSIGVFETSATHSH